MKLNLSWGQLMYEYTPEINLLAAVILQAINDHRKGMPDAKEFLDRMNINENSLEDIYTQLLTR